MKLKDFKYFFIFCTLSTISFSQNFFFGTVKDSKNKNLLRNVFIFNSNDSVLSKTDSLGSFYFSTNNDSIDIFLKKESYSSIFKKVIFDDNIVESIFLMNLSKNIDLDEVSIFEDKNQDFSTNFLKDIENNSIFQSKKTELIISKNKTATSVNNPRLMYNQTTSLNIYQTDDAGLQLNIGGRGLDPKRSSNFNVRQNGYEISADPLGYPESYYSPPFESLESIQIVRGAGALQYGTQFGGLVNFIIKKPNKNKNFDLILRNTIGSNFYYSNFTSVSGTLSNFSYLTYFNYKRGDGFRPNSNFNSYNFYSFLNYNLNNKINLSFEFTFLDYLAQQPGGLTDRMFYNNLKQSNRERNWFDVKWLLYNVQFSYDISENTNISFSSFLLDAHRYSLGFRSNRVDQIDSFEERDLIKSSFDNFGIESRLIHNDNIIFNKEIFLFGLKIYSGTNSTIQGPGSSNSDSNFNFQNELYPNYENQSNYSNPNLNFSFFNENIFYLNDKISLVPGIRFEYIKTSSSGFYKNINTDAAGNTILNEIIYSSPDDRIRSFLLYGIGLEYNPFKWFSFYSNYSKNYRAVTFADINVISPNFIINPDIKDESGYTFDSGIRGSFKKIILYDLSAFYFFYNDRIGFIQKEVSSGNVNTGIVKNEKGNVGNAIIFGQELLINLNISNFLFDFENLNVSYFINFSNINSEYVESDVNGIVGNSVEFVPNINFKNGLEIKYKKIKTHLQYSFMSSQFTDATNSIESDLSGVIGQIPKYRILDFSLFYSGNKINYEFGVNNLLNEFYFTNRATGYPGPGIIPSPTRNFYFTLQYNLN